MTTAKSYIKAICETSERLDKIVGNLVKRCIKEMTNPTEPHNPQLFVIRVWNVLRTLGENEY